MLKQSMFQKLVVFIFYANIFCNYIRLSHERLVYNRCKHCISALAGEKTEQKKMCCFSREIVSFQKICFLFDNERILCFYTNSVTISLLLLPDCVAFVSHQNSLFTIHSHAEASRTLQFLWKILRYTFLDIVIGEGKR